MNCHNCGSPMYAGELDLKASGTGISSQASLSFNGKTILTDEYFPFVRLFRKGTKLTAHRCSACRTICLQEPRGVS
jgi:hypothetical protein